MTAESRLVSCVSAHLEYEAELYYRLVLLVGASRLSMEDLAEALGAQYVNVSLELSQSLLEVPLKNRTSYLSGLLNGSVGNSELILLDKLEILFDPSLKQDPLRLLQNISRNRTVVAVFPGTMENGKLVYAAPGHPEYHWYRAEEFILVEAPDIP